MARTRASVGAKLSSGKSNKARCAVAPTTTTVSSTEEAFKSKLSAGSSEKVSRSAGGGNPVCPRETPKWQRPINTFFISKQENRAKDDGAAEDTVAAGSSNSKPKHNIIESDEESPLEKSKNSELDTSIELQPLTADNSHKIEEYYLKSAKGKGVGKKSKAIERSGGSEEELETDEDDKSEKENASSNIEDSEESNSSKTKNTQGRRRKGREDKNGVKSKRERDESLEEKHVSKKVKIN